MAILVKKREGESTGSIIYRFTRRVRQSGVLREARKRRFKDRPVSRVKRKTSAVYKEKMRQERVKAKKLGIV